MKRLLNGLLVALLPLFAVLFLAGEADAQRRVVVVKPRRTVVVKPKPVYANPQKAKVDALITRVETQVDKFVGLFNDSLDNSALNGSNREDYLNKRARDLESATDELRREFDRRDSWAENKEEVRRCLNIATDINVAMKTRKLGARTETVWAEVRAELNALANAYNLPQVGAAAYK